MKRSRPPYLFVSAAALALFSMVFAGHQVFSQAARTIRIVVPTNPGGVNDLLGRLIGDQIARTQGLTVVVENRPGAGEIIGTEVVARAAPDGNTFLVAANPFLINPHLHKVNYQPLTSFEAICELATAPTLIVVNASSPYHTLADLLAAARAKPGALTMASVGPGSPFQLGFEELKRLAKVDMTFVPYPGNGPSVNALLGNQVTMMFGTYANVAEHLKAGQLRAIAATTPKRIAALPELPTVAELGFPGFEVPAWFGSFAPAKTPKDKVSQLADWSSAAMHSPDVAPRLATLGLYPADSCGQEFANYLRNQFEELGRIIHEANIKAE